MAPTTIHLWLAVATLGLHVIVVARMIHLQQGRKWLGPEDGALIVLAETALALLLIDGIYLSGPLGLNTRVVHHMAGFAPLVMGVFFVLVVNHSVVMRSGRRIVGWALGLFIVNSILIFLAYWVSLGAAFGWWMNPEYWK